MSKTELRNSAPTAVSIPPEQKREPSQVTLSTIGDVGVAIESLDEAPKKPHWRSVLVFFVFLYALTLATAWLLAEAAFWTRVSVIAFFPAFFATVAFWWRQRWKFRAKEAKFKLKVCEEALDSVGYETINGVNAIRANLIGFRLANPEVNYPDHLDVIEDGAKRIDHVIQKAQDPVAWYARKKNKKKQDTEQDPGQLGEDTRSRISL